MLKLGKTDEGAFPISLAQALRNLKYFMRIIFHNHPNCLYMVFVSFSLSRLFEMVNFSFSSAASGLHRWSEEFKSGLWLSHSKTVRGATRRRFSSMSSLLVGFGSALATTLLGSGQVQTLLAFFLHCRSVLRMACCMCTADVHTAIFLPVLNEGLNCTQLDVGLT